LIAGIVIGSLAGLAIVGFIVIKIVYGTIAEFTSQFTKRSDTKGDEQLAALM
jgi:hypothetical protein